MHPKIKAFLGLGLFAVLTMPTLPAAAKTEISTYKLRSKSLIANFEGASDDGCWVTQTSLLFTESVLQDSGPPVAAPPTTLVEVDYANACTGESFSLTGGTTAQSVAIANDLGSATFSANIPISDGAGNDAVVALNVAWAANAPANRAKDTIKVRDPSSMTIDHFDFQTRAADVSGTASVVLGTQAGPTNLNLLRFSQGGQVGENFDSQRTVMFFNR